MLEVYEIREDEVFRMLRNHTLIASRFSYDKEAELEEQLNDSGVAYMIVSKDMRFGNMDAMPVNIVSVGDCDSVAQSAAALEPENFVGDDFFVKVYCYEVWRVRTLTADELVSDYEAKYPSSRTSQQLQDADEEVHKKAQRILDVIGYQSDNKIWRAAFDICTYYDEIYCSNIYGSKGDCIVLSCQNEVDLVNAYFDLLDLRAAKAAERSAAHAGLIDYKSDLHSEDFPF